MPCAAPTKSSACAAAAGRGALATAATLFATREGFDFSLAWEVGDALAHYDFAAAHATAGRPDDALKTLDKAFVCGWADFRRLESDPAFERLRHHDISGAPQGARQSARQAAVPDLAA